jgi:hypothetical protein
MDEEDAVYDLMDALTGIDGDFNEDVGPLGAWVAIGVDSENDQTLIAEIIYAQDGPTKVFKITFEEIK